MASVSSTEDLNRDILVVEDDPEINRLIGAYVELAGFQYVGALSGADALARAGRQLPLAVILDLMLPDISGWEVARCLKSQPLTHSIPIIILTALDNDDSRQEGRQHGVAEYMTKPFDPEKLLEILNKYAGASHSAPLV